MKAQVAKTQEVIMGKRGPVPKPSGTRRRRNKKPTDKGYSPSAKERLYQQATQLNILGRSKMTKAQLETAIRDAGAKPDEAPSSSPPATPPAPPDQAGKVEPPAVNKKWHPIARRWYESLAKSGQSAYYQESDWMLAQLTAEAMSRELQPQVVGFNKKTGKPVKAAMPIKGQNLASYLKSMTALMVSEGDRRRVGIELGTHTPENDSPPEKDPKVTVLDDYRKALANG